MHCLAKYISLCHSISPSPVSNQETHFIRDRQQWTLAHGIHCTSHIPHYPEETGLAGIWGGGPLIFLILIFTLFYFTVLYWFCHTLTWISHGCTWVPNPEPPSYLPPHIISLDHPSAPAPSILYPVSNVDWWFVSYVIVYMFQCHSPKSSHPRPLPQSPKVCSIHLCLFCCLTYRVIITIFLNSIYMC